MYSVYKLNKIPEARKSALGYEYIIVTGREWDELSYLDRISLDEFPKNITVYSYNVRLIGVCDKGEFSEFILDNSQWDQEVTDSYHAVFFYDSISEATDYALNEVKKMNAVEEIKKSMGNKISLEKATFEISIMLTKYPIRVFNPSTTTWDQVDSSAGVSMNGNSIQLVLANDLKGVNQ